MSKTGNWVGRYLIYPMSSAKRQAEGGRRLRHEAREGTPSAPLVTIITVCWNSAKTIEQTFQSVRSQTYSNIEYIVVDGGSTDGTVEILKEHEGFIDYYVSESDKGLYYAMNKGVELAQGDYILILNSDDWYTPDCVEALVEARAKTRADFVSGLANYVDSAGKFLRLQPSFSFNGNIYFMMPLRHETMLLSRDIYNRVGPYDSSFRVISDRDFTTRLYEMGHTHHEIPRALMNFRDTGISSVNIDGLRAERSLIIKKNFPFLKPADVEALAFIEQLEPNQLEEMVANYEQPKLSYAAADMIADRQGRNNKKWSGVNASSVRAIGAETKRSHRVPLTQRMMRVATFVTSDHGGAGLGTQRRVAALRAAGVDARIYCLFKNYQYPHIQAITADIPGSEEMERPAVHKIWRNRAVVTKELVKGYRAREFFSMTGSVLDFRKHARIFDEADIVHFHWPVGMVDFDTIGEMLEDKPVVWTMADMNPFTGGCHYSEGCEGYTKSCHKCPLLSGDPLANEILKTKLNAYEQIRNLQVISPSNWLANRAEKSKLFGNRPIHRIPNALPINEFTPTNMMVARHTLNLPLSKKLILFGADNVKNLRKGGDLMMAAIKKLRSLGKSDQVEGVVFGSNKVEFDIPVHSMGHIDDTRRLSLVYAAADVFASPSREDSGPMTVAESLLSGTPVVAFNIGNAEEIVEHKVTGYIARQENVEDFTKGLIWALGESNRSKALQRSLLGCLSARAHNDPITAAARHIALYETMLAQSARGYSSRLA